MSVLAIDSETALIEPGRLAPPLACVSTSTEEEVRLYHHTEAREILVQALWGDQMLVGHNIAFDMAVFAAKWPDLLPAIFSAYAANRVSDTGIRAKLNHIAMGIYRRFEKEDGTWVKLNYGLADLARRHLGIELEKGTWQLRFGELIDQPLAWWPAEACEYAMTDAVTTFAVWQRQEQDRKYLEDEFRQSRAEWWLHLMSCWGLHTDPIGVREFARRTQQKYDEIAAEMVRVGLMRLNGTRNVKAVQSRMTAACLVSGKKVEMTSGGKVGKANAKPKTDADCCERSGDPVLERYAELSSLKKTLSTDIPLLQRGTHTPIQARFETLLETGRTSSSPNVQNWPTEMGMRECVVPRRGWVFAFADYSGFELRTWAQVCICLGIKSKMAEALNAGNDPHLELARRILGISYEEAEKDYEQNPKGRVYFPRQCGKVCFHPDTEVLTHLGWKGITTLSMNDEVCSAKLADDGDVVLEWEHPLALTSRYFSGNLVHLKSEGIDLRITPDHRMCGWRRVLYRDKRPVRDRVVTVLPHELGTLRYWPNAGVAPGHLCVDERLLRIAVAVQADGHYPKYGSIRLGFTKQRKIDRLRGLLKQEEYKFKLVGSAKVSTFYLSAELGAQVKPLLTPDKKLPWWWVDLEPSLRVVVLDEVRFWDSHTFNGGTGYGYCTTPEENADVLQALATLTARKSRKVRKDRRHPYPDAFKVSVKSKHRSRGGNLEVVDVLYSGDVYCLTTRNDTIVVRDGGIPVITRQCNFGYPGGLGAERFRDYARKGYGVVLTKAQAEELRNFWYESWPEAREYFRRIDIWCQARVPFIKQVMSNRIRGNVSFTEASNGMFQALAADAAKRAGFLIARACYVDRDSPLYDCRPVDFVHDEFVVEAPDDEFASDAAEALARLMIEGAAPFLPDVPPVVKPLLARRWSKSAKALRVNGRLVPWDFESREAAE